MPQNEGYSRSLSNTLPGRVNNRLNYVLDETVVRVPVLDKVKEARKEVEEVHSADPLGVRGPQWLVTTQLRSSKHSRQASDQSLANSQVLSASFRIADFRVSLPSSHKHDSQRYHAFTRGDVTTGWNHSTELTPRERQEWQRQQDNKARDHSLQTTRRLAKYETLVERQARRAQEMRLMKEAQVLTRRELEEKYGPEGAAAALDALSLAKPVRSRSLKATWMDLQAVEKLPEY